MIQSPYTTGPSTGGLLPSTSVQSPVPATEPPSQLAAPAVPIPAWRRVGTDVTEAVSTSEALQRAGLNWTVQEQPVALAGTQARIAGHKAIVREDTGVVLGLVGRRYTPIQNHDAFAWVDGLITQGVRFETAGVIGGGRLVWMLLALPGELRIDGTDDVTRPYVLVINAHDGSRSLQVLRTAIRLVCSNTLVHALREAKGRTLALRHTSGSLDRLDEARRVLGVAQAEFRLLQQAMEQMVRVRLSEAKATSYFKDLLDARDDEQSKGRVDALLAAFHDPRQSLPGVRGTLWAAVNAVSQFVDWDRPVKGATPYHKDQSRLRSMWLGSGAALKAKAWRAAESMLPSGRA